VIWRSAQVGRGSSVLELDAEALGDLVEPALVPFDLVRECDHLL